MTQKQPKKEAKTEQSSDEIAALKEQVQKQETQINDYVDHLKRLQAEFENYLKRTEKERLQFIQSASERIIVKLLLIVDDFERALQQKDLPEQTRKGLEMMFKNLHKILDDEKVQPINSVGEKVDPYKHEVLLKSDSDKDEDIIIEELQKGYTMNGKVIRYAKVKVSTGVKNHG
jgi:molecular chaperone GrpE